MTSTSSSRPSSCTLTSRKRHWPIHSTCQSLWIATRRQQGDAASLPLFKKAVEQDPEFALAHARLSTVYSNLGETESGREHIIKAYALKDKVATLISKRVSDNLDEVKSALQPKTASNGAAKN